MSAATVERDYVLTHFMAALSHHPRSEAVQFKGGTALRLCYLEDYRYSADIDLNLAPGWTAGQVGEVINETAIQMQERIGLPDISFDAEISQLSYIGPLGAAVRRKIKLDLSTDETVLDWENRRPLLQRYSDQPESGLLRVYNLEEVAAEKVRCIFQRLQCRDLFDLWHLSDLVEFKHIKADFDVKMKSRSLDPEALGARIDTRLASYRDRWEDEIATYLSAVPEFETVRRTVTRVLRQAGYLE